MEGTQWNGWKDGQWMDNSGRDQDKAARRDREQMMRFVWWEVQTGRNLEKLSKYSIATATYSPDGTRIVTAS